MNNTPKIEILGHLATMALHHGEVWEEIHDAVAELIERERIYREALEMVRDYVVTMKGRGHEYQVAIDAALARIGGTS